MKYLLLLAFLPLLASADKFDLTEDELNPDSEDVLIKRPEKHLRNEAMIYDFNSNLGIKDQRKYTGTDTTRFSVAGHVSGDYEHFSELVGFEANIMRRSERYHQAWWGGQFFRHQTQFAAITQNHTSSTGTGDGAFQRPNNAKATVQGVGLGGSYRFKLLLEFYPTEDVFESVDVFANYLSMDESDTSKTYRGWGLSTNYGIHKRTDTSFFYGGKFSYNLASVTREKLGDENRRERTLTLGWLSMAFEMGFFY